MIDKICPVCNKSFKTDRGNKVYCSDKCCKKFNSPKSKAERMKSNRLTLGEVMSIITAAGMTYAEFQVMESCGKVEIFAGKVIK